MNQSEISHRRTGRPRLQFSIELFNEVYPSWIQGKLTTEQFGAIIGLSRETTRRRILEHENGQQKTETKEHN